MIGRDDDIDTVERLLRAGARAVTLTGPGGVGKTSLALEAARRVDSAFPGGIYFVALEEVTDLAGAWPVIASALGAEESTDAGASVVATLRARRALVVLDNMEQLRDAALLVNEMLEASPVAILATSRGPLRITFEQQYPVSPVAPDAAITLFERAAQRVRPGFVVDAAVADEVADICSALDGLPLAIELVASRIRHLSVSALAVSIEQVIASSRDRNTDRPDRQRTLEGAVGWSFDLLDDGRRRDFCRLGTFAGGFALDAAAAVLETSEMNALDALDDLADLSLVSFVDSADASPRAIMLGVVREFAIARLAGDEDVAARRAHATHFAELAERAEARLGGPEQLAWNDRLNIEHDNLRAAFRWAISLPSDRHLGVRIAAALGRFWYRHGRADGREWLEQAVAVGADDAGLAAQAAQALGVLQQQHGDNDLALASFSSALALARSVADTSAIARALNSVGVTHLAEGRLDDAERHFVESVAVARDAGDDSRVSAALSNLALARLGAGRPALAIVAMEEALAIDRALGDPWAVAVGEINLGAALIRVGDVETGWQVVAGTLPSVVELDDPDLLVSVLESAATAAGAMGDSRRAILLVAGADQIRAEASVPRTPTDDAFLERELGPARAAFDRTTFDSVVMEGRALALDALISLARPEPSRVDTTPLGAQDQARER